MESYFERLQQIGTAAVADLRGMDSRHTEMQKSYLEDLRKGNLTEQGYRGLVQALDSTRNKKVREVKNQIAALIAALQDEYNTAVDKHTALSSAAIDNADVEMLKSIPITAADFDLLVEKHRGNPTMLRLLDAYRNEHHIQSNWRYQTPDQRKEIFNNACFTVETVAIGKSVVKAVLLASDGRFNQDRKQRIAYLVSTAYHKLQDSNPDKFPIPTIENDTPVASNSSFFF